MEVLKTFSIKKQPKCSIIEYLSDFRFVSEQSSRLNSDENFPRISVILAL